MTSIAVMRRGIERGPVLDLGFLALDQLALRRSAGAVVEVHRLGVQRAASTVRIRDVDDLIERDFVAGNMDLIEIEWTPLSTAIWARSPNGQETGAKIPKPASPCRICRSRRFRGPDLDLGPSGHDPEVSRSWAAASMKRASAISFSLTPPASWVVRVTSTLSCTLNHSG